MLKNYTLIKAPASSKAPYLLLDTEAVPFSPFEVTIKRMVNLGYSLSTIEQYAGHLARFLDFMFEAANLVDAHTPEVILDAIYSYKSFLLFGTRSSDPLSSAIAKSLGKKDPTSQSSLAPIEAAIKFFLLVSEGRSSVIDSDSIFHDLAFREAKALNSYERQKILAKSMLAGVIAGGPMFTRRGGTIFGIKNLGSATDFVKRPIPYDKILPLLDSFKSYRDKTYYSLLAASGCRGHEARQIRLEDIDVINRKVYLIPPKSHKIADLTESEWKMLSWKGRATKETFLIEPFKTFFFESLLQYRRHERISLTSNSYVFQQKNGRPFFATSRASRSQNFRQALKKLDLDIPEHAAHSLRHSYGGYMVNYLPLPNGNIGLPLPTVKFLMGHASLSSTEIYAKRDSHIVDASIEYANLMIFGLNKNVSLNQIRIGYLQSEIDNLMELERQACDD